MGGTSERPGFPCLQFVHSSMLIRLGSLEGSRNGGCGHDSLGARHWTKERGGSDGENRTEVTLGQYLSSKRR